ncbi:unnamed protein product [Notodromas monacha]|uniref:THD domain-containing protein n=1 Tax=Notodromas monacha TaxID=399045 RepID=A0A7R9BPU3_9CRUS|nr:unnamed protein product [Notodromas monacha]CAG0919425.1 unnamed protein product [Notodromas monacha]
MASRKKIAMSLSSRISSCKSHGNKTSGVVNTLWYPCVGFQRAFDLGSAREFLEMGNLDKLSSVQKLLNLAADSQKSNSQTDVSVEWIIKGKSRPFITVAVLVLVVLGFSIAFNAVLCRRLALLEKNLASLQHLVETSTLILTPDPADRSEIRTKRQTRNDNATNTRRKNGRAANVIRGVQFRPCFSDVLDSESNGGLITDWHPEWSSNPFKYDFDPVTRSVMTVLEDGIYMVYAQVYFLNSYEVSSFEILVRGGNAVTAEREKVLARCSDSGSTLTPINKRSEASCYTSTIVPLSKGDSIFVRVRETSRVLNASRGNTFLGVFKLSKSSADEAVMGKKGLDPQCPIS